MENKELQKRIGENLKTLRKQKQSKKNKNRYMSQEELAYDLEMSPAHLRRIEKGIGNPTILTLLKLANHFRVSVMFFLEDHQEPAGKERKRQSEPGPFGILCEKLFIGTEPRLFHGWKKAGAPQF